MEAGIQEINVDEIMREIRENIKKRGYSDEVLSFSEVAFDGVEPETGVYDADELHGYFRQMKLGCEVSYYTPIPKRGVLNLAKCAIRKIMAFLFRPILTQQNSFNEAAVKGMISMKKYMDTLSGGQPPVSGNGMSAQVEQKFFENQERETERLGTKLLLLEQEVEELKRQLQSRNS